MVPRLGQFGRLARSITLALCGASSVTGCAGRIERSPAASAGQSGAGAGGSAMGGSGMAGAGGAAPACAPALPAKLWKLTTAQLRNTLAVFAPGSEDEAERFGTIARALGSFSNDASRLDLSLPVTTALEEASGRVGRAAVQALGDDACLRDGADDAGCAPKIVATLGRRAYRRPLDDGEIDELVGFYREQRQTLSVADAWTQVAAAMTLSPEFLFRSELGSRDGSAGHTTLTAYEIASRLSYTLTDAPPDDALIAAAEAGTLATRAGRTREAQRLLTKPAAIAARTAFLRELFPWDDVATARKDQAAYPDFGPALAQSMITAVERRVADLLGSPAPAWRDLLLSDRGYVDAPLAKLYGMTDVTGAALQPRALGPQRRGLLTEPALIASLSDVAETKPVHRGHFVAAQLLCRDLPPPPAGVPPLPAQAADSPLMRDRLAAHGRDPQCAGCHRFMDPFGLALESYDAFGRLRTEQDGHRIDTSARVAIGDDWVDVAGAGALAERIADSTASRACFARQQARWALGADVPDDAACWLDDVTRELLAGDGDLNRLIVRLVADDASVERRIR